MENLKIKIQNEYKVYVKNFMKNNKVEDLFESRTGYDIAIAKSFKEYFDNMLYDDHDVIIKTVEIANKVEMNLFNFVIENYWGFDNSFDFMLYEECREFLKELN